MSVPYTSSRAGRFGWMMQRVSALLLIALAFAHFGIQHFSSDAVSTGLTVAARMSNPWWQAFYVIFIILALYHGINGLLGVIADYAPKRICGYVAGIVFWTLGSVFAIVAISNVIGATSVAEAKTWYTVNGFVQGETHGNPPFAPSKEYDTRTHQAEMQLFNYYLDKHTHQGDAKHITVADIIKDAGDDSVAAGDLFDAWCLSTISAGAVDPAERSSCHIFSSSYEFAVWAAHVRLRDAQLRLKSSPEENAAKNHEQVIINAYANLPAYTSALH